MFLSFFHNFPVKLQFYAVFVHTRGFSPHSRGLSHSAWTRHFIHLVIRWRSDSEVQKERKAASHADISGPAFTDSSEAIEAARKYW